MRRLALSSGGALLLALTMLATLAATSLAAEPRWQWQNPLPQGNSLGAVDVVDSLRAVAVGDAGTILLTVDGGRTCLLYTSDAADDLLCVDLGGRRIIK